MGESKYVIIPAMCVDVTDSHNILTYQFTYLIRYDGLQKVDILDESNHNLPEVVCFPRYRIEIYSFINPKILTFKCSYTKALVVDSTFKSPIDAENAQRLINDGLFFESYNELYSYKKYDFYMRANNPYFILGAMYNGSFGRFPLYLAKDRLNKLSFEYPDCKDDESAKLYFEVKEE